MRYLLLSSAVVLAFVTPARAADLPVKAPPAAVMLPPPFTWMGFYIGANAGYGWGSADFDAGPNLDNQEGGSVGGQIGYNWQVGEVVFGVEADLQYADLTDDYSFLNGSRVRTNLDYFGTVRARLGYAFDMFLPYVTGGLAYGKNKVNFDYSIPDSADNTHVGYTVGGGVEYAFSPNWSTKVEYLWTDLGDETYIGRKVDVSFSTVRAGINYRF